MQIEFLKDTTFYVTAESKSSVYNWSLQTVLKPGPTTAIRFVRGAKSQNTTNLFDEFSAALQFPYYFGENWNAFNDCISDLDWLNCEFCVVVIFNSDRMLIDEDKSEFETLMKILLEARARRTESLQSVDDVLKDLPFYVVLQCDARSIEVLRERLTAAEIAFKRV